MSSCWPPFERFPQSITVAVFWSFDAVKQVLHVVLAAYSFYQKLSLPFFFVLDQVGVVDVEVWFFGQQNFFGEVQLQERVVDLSGFGPNAAEVFAAVAA